MIANPNTRFFRLKAAQQELIAMAGGIERTAELTSFGKSHVGRWNNPGNPDLMPIDVVLQLEAAFGMPLVTAAMAELNGRRLTDPSGEAAVSGNAMLRHAETMKSAGDLLTAGAMAFADGKLTPAEAAQLDKVAASLVNNAAEFRKDLAATRGNGGLSVVEGGAA